MKFPTILGVPREEVGIFEFLGSKIAKKIRNTGITPNQVTIFRLFFSIPIYYCLYMADYKHYIIAGILFEIHVLLDSIDGPLAKFNKMETKFGEWMEEVLDTILLENFCLFGFFLALGIYRVEQNFLIWVILFFNVFGYISTCPQ